MRTTILKIIVLVITNYVIITVVIIPNMCCRSPVSHSRLYCTFNRRILRPMIPLMLDCEFLAVDGFLDVLAFQIADNGSSHRGGRYYCHLQLTGDKSI